MIHLINIYVTIIVSHPFQKHTNDFPNAIPWNEIQDKDCIFAEQVFCFLRIYSIFTSSHFKYSFIYQTS